jgi:hypothetical protein
MANAGPAGYGATELPYQKVTSPQAMACTSSPRPPCPPHPPCSVQRQAPARRRFQQRPRLPWQPRPPAVRASPSRLRSPPQPARRSSLNALAVFDFHLARHQERANLHLGRRLLLRAFAIAEAPHLRGACPLFRRRRCQNAVASRIVHAPLTFLAKTDISRWMGSSHESET